MSNKNTQQTINNIIDHIDSQFWHKIAVKKLDQIKKPLLRDEAHKILKDIELMQKSQNKVLQNQFKEQNDMTSKLYERYLCSFAKLVRQDMSKSLLGQSVLMKKKTSSKISNRRMRRKTTKVYTQGHETINNSSITPVDLTVYPLYTPQKPNQQELVKDNQCRAVYQQKLRFYQSQKQLQNMKKTNYLQSFNQQMKRMSQSRYHTYDYEGNVMPLKAQKNNKIRVYTVNSQLKNSSFKPKLNKNIQPRISTVQVKRVVVSRQKTDQTQSQDIRGTRFAKTVPIKNVIDIFKNNMQMGVSFTDVEQKSTFYGRNINQSFHNSVKLSNFKENKSSFKPRMHSQGRQISKGIFKPKKHNLDLESNAESKSLSSSFCKQVKSIGKINKNHHLYSQVFSELELRQSKHDQF